MGSARHGALRVTGYGRASGARPLQKRLETLIQVTRAASRRESGEAGSTTVHLVEDDARPYEFDELELERIPLWLREGVVGPESADRNLRRGNVK